jgi:hypothetical protein
MTIKATKNLSWDDWLTVWFGTTKHDGPDLHFSGPRRCDRSLLYGVFCLKPVAGVPLLERSLVEELEARGYDTTTIEFRVKKKVTP